MNQQEQQPHHHIEHEANRCKIIDRKIRIFQINNRSHQLSERINRYKRFSVHIISRASNQYYKSKVQKAAISHCGNDHYKSYDKPTVGKSKD